MGDRRRIGALVIVFLLVAFASPTAAVAAECEGDECQAPPPPPAEVIPATSVVEGPGNPPVRFEGEKPKTGGKPKHKHPKRPSHKGHAKSAHASRHSGPRQTTREGPR